MYLKDKIRINMDEYKYKGLFKTRQQAIALSYSQINKARPQCNRFFNKRKRSN